MFVMSDLEFVTKFQHCHNHNRNISQEAIVSGTYTNPAFYLKADPDPGFVIQQHVKDFFSICLLLLK